MGTRTFFIPLGSMDETNYYTKGEIDLMIADFITNTVDDLVNYYTKSETYTQTEVNTLIGNIQTIHFEFAASTSDVTDPQSNVIYLIGPTGSGSDKYEEYVYSNNTWTKIGDTSIDLSDYVTTSDLQTALNDYVTTTALQTALADYTPSARLSTVATSGAYADLTGTPTLATVATSGNYSDLNGKPNLAAVATSGAYSDLNGTPELSTVATTGSYNDLTDKPTIPVLPTLATVATTGDYTDLTNTPNLAAVATTGAYSDLTGTPTLATVATTGNYADLNGTPTIPTVGTGTVTLTQNGATIGTFGLNDTDDKTIEIPAGGGGSTEEIEQAIAAAINDTRNTINQDLHNNYVKTQTMSDALKSYAIKASLDGYYTKSDIDTTIGTVYTEIEDKEKTVSFAINDLEENKQDKLISGAGITIGTDNTISAIGTGTVELMFTLDGIGTVTYNVVIN